MGRVSGQWQVTMARRPHQEEKLYPLGPSPGQAECAVLTAGTRGLISLQFAES